MFRARPIFFTFAFLGGVLFAPLPVGSQTPPAPSQAAPPQATPPAAEKGKPAAPSTREIFPDYFEEMRLFILEISKHIRASNPDFVILLQNGMQLMNKAIKPDPWLSPIAIESTEKPKTKGKTKRRTKPRKEQPIIGGTRFIPARKFMRAIDGFLVEALQVGNPDFDLLPGEDEMKRFKERLKLAETAVDHKLTVLVMDYARTPKMVDESYKRNKSNGFVSFAAHKLATEMDSPPPYPKHPFEENSDSILSLSKIRNFLYLRNTESFGREDEYVLKLHENNYDLIVVDVFHKSKPLSKQAVETLKFKKLGSRRMVLAYMDIGTVANYMYYWQPEWWDRLPNWVAEEHPDDPDNKFYVEFWRKEWREIVTGSPGAFIQGILNLGFDGVVLGGMESVNYFIGATEGW
ncbi:MAG: hypothetical protein OEY85_12860 [Rhodospirillales bacterium]|nr:hypothetical protein [Rhodospirillales bacterium]